MFDVLKGFDFLFYRILCFAVWGGLGGSGGLWRFRVTLGVKAPFQRVVFDFRITLGGKGALPKGGFGWFSVCFVI